MHQYRVQIILIWMTFDLFSVEGSSCFKPEEELKICTSSINFTKMPQLGVGYDFGFGSINDTEEMCGTKWHIKVLDCMKERANISCQKIQFYRIIWEFTLNSERLKKGVNYICQEHNLRVFNEHKTKCLVAQEKEAQSCVKSKAPVIGEAIKDIENRSQDTFTNIDQYYDNIRMILNKYECKVSKMKLVCLYDLLHSRCPPDAVRLILNYFKEILPSLCYFSYEQQLQNFMDKSEQSKQLHSTISPYPVFDKYKNNDSQMCSGTKFILYFFLWCVGYLHF